MTMLDTAQLFVCGAIGYATICRLHRLRVGTSKLGPIVAQMALLAGSSVLALGFLLPGVWRDPATVPSLFFSGCVLVCVLAGAQRWRDRAPADTDRAPFDDTVPAPQTHGVSK